MKEAKLFLNGNSQAVRLPKEYRFEGDSVYINKVGRTVMLLPKDDPWEAARQALEEFTPDFMAEREQGNFEERQSFD